ncbi:MAG: LapA family protein [Niabella sp.]
MPLKYFLLIVFLFPLIIQGQSLLKGKVYKYEDETTISGASIMNMNTKIYAFSDRNGSYKIYAKEGDNIVFFALEHEPDTVKVEFELLRSGYDAYLKETVKMLSNVIVSGNYSADSLERHQYYAHLFNIQTGVTGGNTPQAGVGIVLSPVSYLSKQSRQIRRLKKKIKEQEKDYYIDYSFPTAWVSSVTGLKETHYLCSCINTALPTNFVEKVIEQPCCYM